MQMMNQIEVLCIDDGSIDGFRIIADEYKSSVRVIHTENRAPSVARNRRIDETVADWFMLMDSDDWVDRELCRGSI